jgi:hypothetical protein
MIRGLFSSTTLSGDGGVSKWTAVTNTGRRLSTVLPSRPELMTHRQAGPSTNRLYACLGRRNRLGDLPHATRVVLQLTVCPTTTAQNIANGPSRNSDGLLIK